MRTPVKPLPTLVRRWSHRARWLRWLDALSAGLAAWLIFLAWQPGTDPGALAISTALLIGAAAAIPTVRRRWRPLSALVALAVSWRIRPGDRAWYVSPDGARLVLVTSRRWLHVVVAGVVQDSVEGVVLCRTRGFLVPASRA